MGFIKTLCAPLLFNGTADSVEDSRGHLFLHATVIYSSAWLESMPTGPVPDSADESAMAH